MINNQHAIHSFSMGTFVWWTGVVEDRLDPEKLGRLKIRFLGYHTDDKALIPTEDLHWAYPSQSITNAAMNGIGQSPTGMVEGTHCWGFFRDGHNAQDPVVCGTWGGIPSKAAVGSRGFNDPSGTYPKSDFLNEPDTNRLARGEKTSETIIQDKKDSVDTGVAIAFGGSWDEPETPYAAKYPYNHVTESESGHTFEVDDTPGAERIHQYHRSGTFTETHPDGTHVSRIVKDRYTVVAGDDFIHVTGVANITISGDANVHVEGDSNIQTGGNHTEEVGGNYDLKIGGTCNIESGGMMALKAPRIDLN